MITNSDTLGIYVHIPFCAQKCRYCDFLSFPDSSDDLISLYIDKLCSEIVGKSESPLESESVDSVYIGGGTPSFINPAHIDEILDVIYARFAVDDNVEITLEANPGSITENNLKSYYNSGVNRLSIGVQTLDANQLKYLGRIHDSDNVFSTYELARKIGFNNINLDLIFGLPEESLPVWINDLNSIISLDPEHISFYSLTIEETTPIFDDIVNDRVQEIDEVEDRVMYHNAIELLSKKGYNHYEISNAAKPGFESRHNLKYWSMENYLGIGLGAHSYMNGIRFANTEKMQEYISADGLIPMTDWIHENTTSDDISEFVFLGLRKLEGISLKNFESLFGKTFQDVYAQELSELVERGLLEEKGDMIRLTPLGLDLSNQVFMEFV